MQVRPIIATFRSVRDKENILRHASSSKILRQKGIFVTEDFGNKKVNGHSPNRKMFQSSVSTKFYKYILCIQYKQNTFSKYSM